MPLEEHEDDERQRRQGVLDAVGVLHGGDADRQGHQVGSDVDTTVAPGKQEVARVAVSLLLERIDDPDAAAVRDHVAGHRIIVRESTDG